MTSDSDNLKRLLGIGRSLVAELDPEEVLLGILAESRQLTGARYVALGVIDEQRTVGQPVLDREARWHRLHCGR
jgi:GAF domain-containing protein